MTNQEKLNQVLKAIELLDMQGMLKNKHKVSLDRFAELSASHGEMMNTLVSGSIALREQIKIDNAMSLVNQLKDLGAV